MKRLLFKIMNWAAALLSHRQRRFLLDRLGLIRLVGGLFKNEFDEVALPNGIKITINPLLHAQIANDSELAYEGNVLRTIEDNLKPGDTFYDVGANIGIFSFVAAGRIGSGGSIHAFEPEENNLACLRRSLERSGLTNLVIHEAAVGPADGSMTFDRRGGAFSGRLVEPGADLRGASVTVKVRAIDSLVADGAPPPTLMKIDVEGGEGGVLEGMRETLKNHGPTVLCELHPLNPQGVQRALDVLDEVGYTRRDLDGTDLSSDLSLSELPNHILATPA